MRLLPFVVAVSAQDWATANWSPFRTATQSSSYNYAHSNPAISLAQTVGCNSCSGQGCPTGTICQYNALAFNPQPCSGTCITPSTANYYNPGSSYGYGSYDITQNPYRLFNAYHTPVSSYNLPPDWQRCRGLTTCNACVSLNGCTWSGVYCSVATAVTCTGSGCAYEPRQCPSTTPGTCAGSSNCFSCTSMPGCAWSGSTCYLSGGPLSAPCTTFGCANFPAQCQTTGGVNTQPCGINEVWLTCGSSNCHEDNCQDRYYLSALADNRVCQNDCWSGCQCMAGGFARNDAGICVPSNQCPSGPSDYYYSGHL